MPLIKWQGEAATSLERSLLYNSQEVTSTFESRQNSRIATKEAQPLHLLIVRSPLSAEEHKNSTHNETKAEEKHKEKAQEQHPNIHALRKGTIAFVAALAALLVLFFIGVGVFVVMWKLKKAFRRPERGSSQEPTASMELQSRDSGNRQALQQESYPHYETISQRMARQQAQSSSSRAQASMAPPTPYRPPDAPHYFPGSPPRQWQHTSIHPSLERLSTNFSSLSSRAELSLSPSSAATSVARSCMPTPSTTEEGTFSSARTMTRSPVTEALLNESFDMSGNQANDTSFDWDRCTFHEQEEEAMWLPGDQTSTTSITSGRRRSASAPVPYDIPSDCDSPQTPKLLPPLPHTPMGKLPKQSSETFAGYSMAPEHARTETMQSSPTEVLMTPPPLSPTSRQLLRFALPAPQSDNSQQDQRLSRYRQMSGNAEPSPTSPSSPSGYSSSMRSLYIGQPSPALSSPAHDSGFRVLSRGPSSPTTASHGISEPYTEPPSPALSMGSAPFDWQRSTNELRIAGAQAIRERSERSLQRAMSSHTLSTPPIQVAKKRSLFLPRVPPRRSRPATAETTTPQQFLQPQSPDETLEVVLPEHSSSPTQIEFDPEDVTSKSTKSLRLHCRLRSGRSRPATADSATTWSSGRGSVVLA